MSARKPKEFKPQRDWITINKNAVHNGCITSRDFRNYQTEHQIMQKPKQLSEGQETNEQFHDRVNQMTHGVHYDIVNEMEDCLTFKTGREAKERALAKRQREMQRNTYLKSNTRQAITQRSTRPTRASLGHQHVAYVPEKPADTFKMKRFCDVDHCAIDDKWE